MAFSCVFVLFPVLCRRHKWLWMGKLSYCHLFLQNVTKKHSHRIFTPINFWPQNFHVRISTYLMLFCLLGVASLYPLLTLTAINLSDQSLKVCIYYVWHLHLFVMILKYNGVFPLFWHLNLCWRPAIHSIAVFLWFSSKSSLEKPVKHIMQ